MSLILIAAGAAVGYQLATRVQMTQMPELVAIMHSLVGLAAVFVGLNAHVEIGRVAAFLPRPGCPSRSPMDRFRAEAYALLGTLSNFAELIGKKTGSRSASCAWNWCSASGSAR
jgi:NAD(P) transhydrogenase subunit beta